jgi:competence protein ComEA
MKYCRMLRDSDMKPIYLLLAGLALAIAADDKDAGRLPDGAGKEVAGRVCIDCHDSGNFRRARLSSGEWSDTVADMVDRGAKLTPVETDTLIAYLAANFGKDSPVRMNTAPFVEMKVVLGFSVAEARAIVDYREKNGPFQSAEDLRKVPGIDVAKVDARKSRMVF